jgi:competence protein ComEA
VTELAPNQPAVLTAWPRSAQLATAFLVGLATALLGVHSYGYLRWGTRPTELERGSELTYRIDLNHADRAELLQLPGIGEKLVERIEDYRRQHGPFRNVEELTQVHGIGAVTLQRLRPWISVEGEQEQDEETTPIVKQAPQSSKRRGETASMDGAKTTKTAARKEAGVARPIDLNQATAAELQRLPGIGPTRALWILEERRKKPFKSVEDLMRVKGIKQKTLEKLRPFITVGPGPERVVKGNRTENQTQGD